MFLNTIISSLSDPSNPYNGQHLHVLKSLAEIKSIVLMTDLPNAKRLMTDLFTICFDVLSGPSKAPTGEELSKNVEHHMTAMLAALVEEAHDLPNEVIDVVLAQFLRADPRVTGTSKAKGKKQNDVDERQLTLLLREAPPAYNMAKNICNSSPDRMAGYISQYFNAVIADVSSGISEQSLNPKSLKSLNDAADEEAKELSEEDFRELSKAHRMLRELWRSSPGVLQNIIPQLEIELGAELSNLRQLATETLGDMISGIGAAGPPPSPSHNPAAFPSQSLTPASERVKAYHFLTTPNSPFSFPSRYGSAYNQFLNRRNDKSAQIRAAWTSHIGRILMTSAGGVGLDSDDEKTLLRYLAETLIDHDERVRLAGVKAIELFEFHDVIQKLGSHGGVSETGSILSNLAERVKDRKVAVRTEAMKVLGKLWGVASGAIIEGNDHVNEILGAIPSRIFDAYYINDLEVNVLIDRVIYESLLPLGYPPLKPKATAANGNSQKNKDTQKSGNNEYTELEIDRFRVERTLALIRDLEPKAKIVFFAKQSQQVSSARFMDVFLKKCEAYNGGVTDKGDKETKQHLGRLIEGLSKSLPESTKAAEDLWKFAKKHDRRSYQLIRFAMAMDSDYRKVYKSIKELTKRIEDAQGGNATLLETLIPLVYRSSALIYNKSHVPAIIELSRTDDKGLASTAHELLKEISTKKPDLFRTHVQDLCKALEAEAPTAKKPNTPSAIDDLKACASFARRFPEELPKDRKFISSMVNFAQFGTPPKAAKHAVTIIMNCSEKKEMHAKNILQHCIQNFEYGSGNYLSQLATLSQLSLLGGDAANDEADTLTDIAINQVLLKSNSVDEGEEKLPDWSEEPDDDLTAKIWALKILVNRVRALGDQPSVKEASEPVYKLLRNILTHEGELSKNLQSPPAHRSWMRLLAARQFLKLSCKKHLEPLLTLKVFNQLATRIQDPNVHVRKGFAKTIMKYLGQERLSTRYHAILFLLAFEPETQIKDETVKWTKSRCKYFASRKDTTMEAIFARLLSLLAHHPDFDKEPENLKDFVQYILFYLTTVANKDNLSLIYHVAQRVKSVRDGIDPSMSENIYVLSDLAQAVIRRYEELHGWSMQAWPGKMKMPAGIFAPLPSHDVAQEIAVKQYVPEELAEQLDDLVKDSLRSKKVCISTPAPLRLLILQLCTEEVRYRRRFPLEQAIQIKHDTFSQR